MLKANLIRTFLNNAILTDASSSSLEDTDGALQEAPLSIDGDGRRINNGRSLLAIERYMASTFLGFNRYKLIISSIKQFD